MINILKASLLICIISALQACGGGGGAASAVKTTTTTTSYSLALTMVDANNNVVNGITYGGGQKIRAVYTDSNGNPVKQTLVSFSVSTNAGAATLASAYVITNDSGVAYDPISPATATTSGAATVSATAGTLTATLDFAISGSTVTIASPILGSTTLAASGTTSVEVLASANSTLASGVTVAFSADCGTLNPTTNTSNGNGKATSSYSAVKADGTSCSGDIKIYASASGNTTNSTLNVASPTASAVNFVSAAPAQIYVTDSGAATHSSMKFRVLDGTGAAFPNASVTAAITTNPGGVGLGAVNATTSALNLQSDSTGYVSFSIYSGTVPGPVKVKVSLSDTVYAYSNNITVQSGPPAQDRFSLSVGTFNLEGQDIDGITTTLTIRVADRQGNAVPDGTVINFTASGGQVQPSCATSRTNGISACSVAFSSQAPRPANGRIAVLAFAEGTKTFTDNDSNNTFGSGDTLIDMGDAYRDDNENGTYDSGEFVLLRGGKSGCPTSFWGTPSRADSCDSSTVATTVRKQVVLIMSGKDATFNLTSASTNAIQFRLNDGNSTGLNPMPYGTTISATAVDNTSGNSLSCTVVSTTPAVVRNIPTKENTSAQLGTDHTVTLTGCATGDQVRVTVTTPLNEETNRTFTIPSSTLAISTAINVAVAADFSITITGGTPPYTAISRDAKIATVTGSSGNYKVTGVKAGNVDVVVTDNNSSSATTKVTVN